MIGLFFIPMSFTGYSTRVYTTSILNKAIPIRRRVYFLPAEFFFGNRCSMTNTIITGKRNITKITRILVEEKVLSNVMV
ncbi:hypothetical protein BW716_24500 [[Flexibacter] sp. ATCC 35208]|nr:hypothetical protein BW716_24500 [[Flexibacter] sp. ATCC 35208]